MFQFKIMSLTRLKVISQNITKKEKYLLIKGNIEAIDKYENILTAQEIEYDLNKKILKSKR